MKPNCQHIGGENIQENSWHNSSIVDVTIVAAEVLKLAANPRLRGRSKIATMSHFCGSHLSHEDEAAGSQHIVLRQTLDDNIQILM